MNDVGENIVYLRRQNHISKEALAQSLDVTPQTVSLWEAGNARPDLQTLEKIAVFFSVDILTVIYGDKNKKNTVAPHRKKYWKGFIVFGSLTLIMIVLMVIFKPYFVFLSNRYYNLLPILTYMYVARPVLYFCIGFFVINGASLIWDIRLYSAIVKITIRIASILLLLFYLTMLFLRFSDSAWDIVDIFATSPALLLIPAIGLHLSRK